MSTLGPLLNVSPAHGADASDSLSPDTETNHAGEGLHLVPMQAHQALLINSSLSHQLLFPGLLVLLNDENSWGVKAGSLGKESW